MFKITRMITDLIECINKAFAIQVFLTVLLLMLFGIVMIFAFAHADNVLDLPIYRSFVLLLYMHIILFEASFYGSSIHKEVCLNYFKNCKSV